MCLAILIGNNIWQFPSDFARNSFLIMMVIPSYDKFLNRQEKTTKVEAFILSKGTSLNLNLYANIFYFILFTSQ